MFIDLRKNHLKDQILLSTVSGVASTKSELIRYFDENVEAVSIITTKSFQVVPNPGNREPIICCPEVGNFGNSVGLRNPGMEYALNDLRSLLAKKSLRCHLNISLSASNIEDFVTLTKAFDPIADSLELNFSCPHAASGYGASIGSSIEIAKAYVQGIREQTSLKSPLLIKLTPNVLNIGEIAKAVIDAGADGVVAINTVTPLIYKHDSQIILNNKLGGKGGQSGEWVKERALECVTQIRNAIGDEPIIIGEGGVSTPSDVQALIKAGADAVGVGSALSRVDQEKWAEFFDCLKQGKDTTYLLDKQNRMQYIKHSVVGVKHHDESTVVLTLDSSMNCKAGQFVFLWIPGVGEKPFSVALTDPLTFVIKNRGFFTSECMKLKVGDTVYVRGLYGKPVHTLKTPKAILLAGGTGEAVLPMLARTLQEQGTSIQTYVGVSSSQGGVLEATLSSFGSYKAVADDSKPGRVIEEVEVSDVENTAIYIVGPEKFMSLAAKRFVSMGVKKQNILISMEKNSMCGVGLCGECSCGGKLTCKQGTFFDYEYLSTEGLL